jgi:hypothetical protein
VTKSAETIIREAFGKMTKLPTKLTQTTDPVQVQHGGMEVTFRRVVVKGRLTIEGSAAGQRIIVCGN